MTEKIAVVGSGVMGQGIAYTAAVGGFRVKLHDIRQEAIDRALRMIEQDLQQGIKRGKLSRQEADAAMARIQTSDNLEETAGDADLVIEAALEIMELKIGPGDTGIRRRRTEAIG